MNSYSNSSIAPAAAVAPCGWQAGLRESRALLARVAAGAAIVALVLTSASAAAAPPNAAAGSRAGQGTTLIPPAVYAARRALLAEQVDGPIIVPGADLIRRDDRKQDLDFWYLTGVRSPYAVVVIMPGPSEADAGGVREVLFLPERYQFAGAQYPIDDPRFRDAAWNQPVQRLYPGTVAQDATGFDEIYPIDELAARLPALVGNAPHVWYPVDHAVPYTPPGVATPTTVRQQLASSISDLIGGRELNDVSPLIARMRLVKDDHEIAALRRAAAISVTGLNEAMRMIQPGLRDLAVAGYMEYVWKREGSPHASFGPIVSSGPASMTLYTLRSEAYDYADRIMQQGDLIFIDYGAAEYGMYTSDVCRTFPVSGRFTDEQRLYYEIVLEAQKAALAEIRPGVMMVDVIRAAARVFRDHGLESNEDIARMGPDRVWGIMPSPTYWLAQHGELTSYSGAGTGVRDLGHHIGLDTIDSRDYSVPLQPGMVFTVEPKIYIPDQNIAIMIEDMILVTDQGYENLSAGAPRDVATIERIMGQR